MADSESNHFNHFFPLLLTSLHTTNNHKKIEKKGRITWKQAYHKLKRAALRSYRIRHFSELVNSCTFTDLNKLQLQQLQLRTAKTEVHLKKSVEISRPSKRGSGTSSSANNQRTYHYPVITIFQQQQRALDESNNLFRQENKLAESIISGIIDEIRSRSENSREKESSSTSSEPGDRINLENIKVVTRTDKNSRYRNVKVINKHFNQKSLAYFYPCRFQQSVSKISSLLCPISLPNRVATSGSRESSQPASILLCSCLLQMLHLLLYTMLSIIFLLWAPISIACPVEDPHFPLDKRTCQPISKDAVGLGTGNCVPLPSDSTV